MNGEEGRASKAPTRAIVIVPYERPQGRSSGAPMRPPQSRLDEAIGLAHAINLEIVAGLLAPYTRPRPATLIGSGIVETVAATIEQEKPDLVIIDHALSPVQQRNLERQWKVKVIDRTGLILEIFGARARTHEGRLQVERAALEYQRSRLVRSWTHLERQRGGFGFLGGPGESQLEIDRRLIGERIAKLNRDLIQVRRTRTLHRKARQRSELPTIALVGYTNAGKSTLFNRITQAAVTARDQLFATLDPTMRAVRLPSGRDAILSDTVGFISDLPTHLVDAFRATLEEVVEADVIIHVRDMAHPETARQAEDVETVLRELGVEIEVRSGIVEALNKIDLLDGESRRDVGAYAARDDSAVPISAITGDGVEALMQAIERRLMSDVEQTPIDVPLSDGASLAWLYRHGEVVERHDDDEVAHVLVNLRPADVERFAARQRQ